MIVVMMGVEDVRQPPAEPVERRQHRRGDRRIDRGAGRRRLVAQQIDVVVPQHRDLLDLQVRPSSPASLSGAPAAPPLVRETIIAAPALR